MSQLRAFMRKLRPVPAAEPVVRFETAMGEQLRVDRVEFRKSSTPLHAFCVTLDFSRASYVAFVSNMKAETLLGRRKGEGMDSWTIRSRLRRTTRFVFEHRTWTGHEDYEVHKRKRQPVMVGVA